MSPSLANLGIAADTCVITAVESCTTATVHLVHVAVTVIYIIHCKDAAAFPSIRSHYSRCMAGGGTCMS